MAKMEVRYINHMGNDLLVCNAARVSFKKEVKEFNIDKDERLIKYLAEHKHWTPFGHPQICLHMKAPVPIRTQCFKHKVGFCENEVSRRYVDDEPEFFVPEYWRKRADNKKQGSTDEKVVSLKDEYLLEWCGVSNGLVDDYLEEYYNHCEKMYRIMIDNKIAPEQARLILPQSMMTEWYWTGSLAAYARFCNLRLDPHSQKEIQDLAKMVSDIIEPLFPVSWKYLVK